MILPPGSLSFQKASSAIVKRCANGPGWVSSGSAPRDTAKLFPGTSLNTVSGLSDNKKMRKEKCGPVDTVRVVVSLIHCDAKGNSDGKRGDLEQGCPKA